MIFVRNVFFFEIVENSAESFDYKIDAIGDFSDGNETTKTGYKVLETNWYSACYKQ